MTTFTNKQIKRMEEVDRDMKDTEFLIDEMYRKSDNYKMYKDAENALRIAISSDYSQDVQKVLSYHFEIMRDHRTNWVKENYPILQKTFDRLFNEDTNLYLEFTK